MVKMKHAGDGALDALEPLIAKIRALPGLTERRRGVFYRKSSAFLHFHEDPAGFFADVKLGDDWSRFPVNTRREIDALIREVSKALA
jgi:hypothetical protein